MAKRDKGAFGLGGPTAKEQDGIGSGRFGFGPHGTTDMRVPLPPARPPDITQRADASQIEGLGTKAEETKGKLSALDATIVAPKGDTSGLQAIDSYLDRIISKVAQVGSGIAGVKAQAASLVAATASTGKVAMALAGATADRGMG